MCFRDCWLCRGGLREKQTVPIIDTRDGDMAALTFEFARVNIVSEVHCYNSVKVTPAFIKNYVEPALKIPILLLYNFTKSIHQLFCYMVLNYRKNLVSGSEVHCH